MAYVEYDSNNSGGSWWLEDKDWFALEKAGWVVEWKTLAHKYTDKDGYERDERGLPLLVPVEESNSRYPSLMVHKDGRFLGALATGAYRHGLSLEDAVAEWEQVTGANSTDAGCACCGQPHTFTLYDDEGKYVTSGPHTHYGASW